MKNEVQSGIAIDITAPVGGTTSGAPVKIGALFGVPVTSNLAGDTVTVYTVGVFDIVAEPAGSGQAWAVGDTIYWDDAAKRLTKTTTSNTKVGYATAAKASTDAIGRIRLVPNI